MVEVLQHEWELERLLEVFRLVTLRSSAPRVLEIGVWEGGTLQHWLGGGRDVVIVDDEMRGLDEWKQWAATLDSSLTAIRGLSWEQVVIDAARALGPYDFIFVDADHRYEAGVQDWRNYRAMVREGGVIAFHDIRRYQHGDLDRLWAEIKAGGFRTSEYHDTKAEWGGIGVVWL